MTDEMLRQAAWNASRMFVEALEEDYDPRAAYPPSPAFRRKLRSLRRRAEHPYAHAALQRAAVFLLVLLLSGGVFLSVDAEARDALRAWIRTVEEGLVLYRFTGDEASAEFPRCRLGWVPEGFTMVSEIDDGDIGRYDAVYQETESPRCVIFGYRRMSGDRITWIAGDEYTYEAVTVNGLPGDFYETTEENGASTLLWFDEERDLLFSLDSDLDREAILRMAESVVPAGEGAPSPAKSAEEREAAEYEDTLRAYAESMRLSTETAARRYASFPNEELREAFLESIGRITSYSLKERERINGGLWAYTLSIQDSLHGSELREVYWFVGHIDGRYVVYGNEAYVPESLREGLDPARYQYEGEDILGAMPEAFA